MSGWCGVTLENGLLFKLFVVRLFLLFLLIFFLVFLFTFFYIFCFALVLFAGLFFVSLLFIFFLSHDTSCSIMWFSEERYMTTVYRV